MYGIKVKRNIHVQIPKKATGSSKSTTLKSLSTCTTPWLSFIPHIIFFARGAHVQALVRPSVIGRCAPAPTGSFSHVSKQRCAHSECGPDPTASRGGFSILGGAGSSGPSQCQQVDELTGPAWPSKRPILRLVLLQRSHFQLCFVSNVTFALVHVLNFWLRHVTPAHWVFLDRPLMTFG